MECTLVFGLSASLRPKIEQKIKVEQRQRSERSSLARARDAGEGAENRGVRFPSVFACLRVLNLTIGAHEFFCLQSVSITVTAEIIIDQTRSLGRPQN
jgi:hypothetical protein